MGAHRVYRERNFAFGQQLLALRTRAGLTQIALAEHIGVHRRSVLNWEMGESYPKAETLPHLIAVFLAQGVFTPGQEAEQAAQLWQQASQDGPHPLAAFDAASVARLLAEHSSTRVPAHPPATPLAPASAPGRVLPEGLVTFLASDIEGSTQRWERAPQAMQQALARHHAIFHQLTELYGGQVFHTAGDSFICVFADASAALQPRWRCSARCWPSPGRSWSLRCSFAWHCTVARPQPRARGISPSRRSTASRASWC